MNKYTKPEPKYEDNPKTITNRLNQKSISLPRIDDTKKLRGYPGLAGTAEIIAKCIPKCLYYVEPFAGTAKVYQELMKLPERKFGIAVLNDKSAFTYKWLSKEFSEAIITNLEFSTVALKYDSIATVTLYDQPWHKEIYLQGFSCFDKKNVAEYDNQVLELCRMQRGKFIICTDRANSRMLKSEFDNFMAIGTYKIAGGLPHTLLTSNMDLSGIPGVQIVKKKN